MQTLEKLLGERPENTFLPKHFTKLPFSRPLGGQEFLHLLAWPMVEKILEEKKSVLRIVKDGRMVKDYVEVTFEEAKKYFESGHTLLVRFAEKSSPVLKEVCDDFAKSFHTEVDIQLYCTPEGHNAFGWHYDVEEVFIIQTKGSKTYSIRPNTVHPNPLVASIPKNLGFENEKTPIEITVTLEEGDFLYIPSGWWHIAKTQRESMHVSIGLMPRSALDITGYLKTHLASHPFWRTRMPVHLEFGSKEEEILFYQDAMAKLGKNLSDEISKPEFIEGFLKWIKTNK